jgi:signal transduction histidine kinase
LWLETGTAFAAATNDLSTFDFSKGEVALLSGPWDYWPYRLLLPGELGDAPSQVGDPNSLVQRPNFFAPNDFVGTLRTVFEVGGHRPNLQMSLLLTMPTRVFIDGQEVAGAGKPGAMDEIDNQRGRIVVDLPSGSRHEIVMQISNHQFVKFNFQSILLGTANAISERQMPLRILNWTYLGIDIAVALVALLLVATAPDRFPALLILVMASSGIIENVAFGTLIHPLALFNHSYQTFAIALWIERSAWFVFPALVVLNLFQKPMRFWPAAPLVLISLLMPMPATIGGDSFIFEHTYFAWTLILFSWIALYAQKNWAHDKRIRAFVFLVTPIYFIGLIENIGYRIFSVIPIFYFGSLAVAAFYIYTIVDHLISARREATKLSDELRATNEGLEQAVIERTRHLHETQAQLANAEKMASLGTLVAGVAHEINTPVGIAITATSQVMSENGELKAIIAGGQLSRRKLEDFTNSVYQGLGIALANLTRAADLVTSFKQVAVDRNSEQPREIDLAIYVKDVLRSLDPLLKASNIAVSREIEPGLQITLQPGALAQIITNFVQNAAHHAFVGISEPHITIEGHQGQNGAVILKITDNGVGMSDDVCAHAFDPFFTTNRQGGGTGLGLHIVHNLVTEALGGTISLQSAPGQGTEFAITLNRLATV